SLFKLNSENFKIGQLEELTKGQGLFYQKFIVEGDNLFSIDKDNKDIAEKMGEWLKPMAESNNVFILLENNADEKTLAEIKKLATKEQEFSKGEIVKARLYGGVPGFNIFSVIDAFTARNKNRAWALYQEAMMKGISAEEILWKLIWAVNNLLVVKNTKDLDKLKMKPFVLTKTKVTARNFSNEELKKLSSSFLNLYHTTFLGTDEFEFGLEKIILEV
ncbi:MAG: hypothetical protein NTV48_00030, partial [Candidatus Vogelbacteria bacterium]|nr:hypothetical protein [Candidatus Vogelbacteria bacterium]